MNTNGFQTNIGRLMTCKEFFALKALNYSQEFEHRYTITLISYEVIESDVFLFAVQCVLIKLPLKCFTLECLF